MKWWENFQPPPHLHRPLLWLSVAFAFMAALARAGVIGQ